MPGHSLSPKEFSKFFIVSSRVALLLSPASNRVTAPENTIRMSAADKAIFEILLFILIPPSKNVCSDFILSLTYLMPTNDLHSEDLWHSYDDDILKQCHRTAPLFSLKVRQYYYFPEFIQI